MTVPTLVDSHCHLDMEQFDADRAAVLERAHAHGVCMIVNPGIDLVHCRQAISLADLHPQVYAAVGIHPNSSADFSEQTLTQLRGLAEHPKVVAIGEIGLDYHWGTVSRPKQAQAFRAQLDLAAELGLPVIIHNREASTNLAQILDEWAASARTRNSPLAKRPFGACCTHSPVTPRWHKRRTVGILPSAWVVQSLSRTPGLCIVWRSNCASTA